MNFLLFWVGGLSVIVIHLLFKIKTYKSKSNTSSTNLPQGKTGWPIIGETLAYLSHPQSFIQDRMIKYSPNVFKTCLLGHKMAVLCGPLANKFVFTNEAKLFKLWLPASDPLSHSDLNPNSSSWKLATQLTFQFLQLQSIREYVSVMDTMTREHLDTFWAPFNEVRVYPLTKEFTFAASCRLFVDKQKLMELFKPFFLMREGMISTPIYVPWTCYYKSCQGAKLGLEKLLQIIRRRRNMINHNSQDLLGRLLMASCQDGNSIKEMDIAITMAGILLASSYTTNNTITSLVAHLADHPHVYQKVLQEQLEIAESKEKGELLSWVDIQKMKYSWNTVCETLRLTAPGQGGGFREVITSFTYAGFDIPKGWKVYWTSHSTHMNPKYFPNPEKFDPTRFEGTGPIPYTFVPFGGGPRMCVGKEYARIQILVFLHNLVTRFTLKRANPNEKITYNPGPIPMEGLRICLQPHYQ